MMENLIDETQETAVPDIDMNQGVTLKHAITLLAIITLLGGAGVGTGAIQVPQTQEVAQDFASTDRADGLDTRLQSVEQSQLRMGRTQQEMLIMMTGMQRDVSNIAESLDVETEE